MSAELTAVLEVLWLLGYGSLHQEVLEGVRVKLLVSAFLLTKFMD